MSEFYNLTLPVTSWPCSHTIQRIDMPVNAVYSLNDRIMAIAGNTVFNLIDDIAIGYTLKKVKQ